MDLGVVLVPDDVVDVVPGLVALVVPAETLSPTGNLGLVDSEGPSLGLQVSLELSHSVLVSLLDVSEDILVVGLVVLLVEFVSLDPELSVLSGEELIGDLVSGPSESQSVLLLDEVESPFFVLLVVGTEILDVLSAVLDVDQVRGLGHSLS